MRTINLYKYVDKAETVITPNKRGESDLPYCYRLVADDGKSLTNGESITQCIDTHDISVWREIEGKSEITPEEIAQAIESIL